MKKIIVLFVCAIVLMGFAAVSQYAEGEQDFTLVNDTGVIIDQLYISKVSTNNWEEDVLGVEQLPDGSSCNVAFSPDEDACNWDIMVKDTEGTAVYWRGVDLCEVTTLTLHIEGSKVWATKE